MALSFDGWTFQGGRLSEGVERVLGHAIGTEFLSPDRPCAREAHARAIRELRDAGLPYVSYDAVRRRVAVIQRWFDLRREVTFVFNRQIPIDLIVVGANGSPVGRPLITLSGTVRVEGDQGWLKAKAEVSFPSAASKTPQGVWRSVEPRGRGPYLKSAGLERRDADGRGEPKRANFRRRGRLARSFDEEEAVLGVFRRCGPDLSFGYLVSSLGSRLPVEETVRRLIAQGKLWSAVAHFRDDSMIHLGSDDVF